MPAPASGAGADPWTPTGADTPAVPALTRPHQDPNAHPVDNTRSLFTRGADVLFGHEPENAQDQDQAHVAGILPAVGAAVHNYGDDPLRGPDTATLLHAYPHLVGAQFGKVKAGYQEAVGEAQRQSAEVQLAVYQVLPQVAARLAAAKSQRGIGTPQVLPEELAKDPLVKQTAIKLGMDPVQFAAQWSPISGQSPEQQADAAARAKETFDQGMANKAAGAKTRAQSWADERVWQPSDLKNGKLDPWSLKGVAFNTALALPALAATATATLGAGAVGGPPAGAAAGTAVAGAIFGPEAYADAKDKVESQANRLLEKADEINRVAPVGEKRGLNPMAQELQQQAADLLASSDKIARTAGALNAVAAVAGNVPVVAVLARSPAGKAILDRMVGAAFAQTVGGRVAGTMVANGAGAIIQASIQKAVDAGIVHEQTTLADALKDIGYAGVIGVTTAGLVGATTDRFGAADRAKAAAAKRDLDSDDLLQRAQAAAAGMGRAQQPEGEYPGYRYNETTHRYEPTGPAATNRQIPGTEAPPGETKGPIPETKGPSGETPAPGAAGQRAAYQAKTQTLNEAAAAAEKRSDVTLEPEEEGWSVHVKGQPIAQFETLEAAREAMAQARKVVGTQPATAEAPATAGAKEAVTPAREPETPLERTQPVQAERRSASTLRQRFEQMTPEQRFAAVYSHELTGMPNRRAYQDAPKKAVQVSADSDGLKAINDVGGHAAGDQALKAVAAALQAEDPHNTFHISGDEFTAQADTEAGAHDLMARVNKRLEDAIVEVSMPDGQVFHLKGLGVSYGVGKNFPEADGNLQGSKTQREAQGLRAPRGQLPPGATIRPREEGGEDHGGHVAGEAGRPQDLGGGGAGGVAKVLGQKVETPAVPTPAQAQAGNYFKPQVAWHGLPIKIENTKGQVRKGIGANGKPFARTMQADYGYFANTKGADADGVDVMMGPHHESDKAFVIDQLDPTGKTWDEHKVQIGVRNEAEAREQYLSHYPKNWKGLGGITELNPGQLKRWLAKGDLTQPIDAESVPRAKVVRGVAPDARHDSILQFLARHPRGLNREEAQSQGIDPADMALSAAHVGIKRAFRANGLSFDHAAEALAEAGYPVTDHQGHYSPNVLLDRLSDELAGHRHYSTHNESQLAAPAPDWRKPLSEGELAKLTIEQAQTRLAQLQEEQERLEREIERAGLSEEASEHETEEDLDRIPFQRNEDMYREPVVKPPTGVREQQDLFGDKVNVQNQIKQLEAALDKKRNTGQESVETGKADDLFSGARAQMDLPKIGEETTRYEIREPPSSARAAKNLRAGTAVPQLDLFANADLPHPAVEAARLAQSVKLAHIGEFRSGVSQVKTWEDAAHILAPLRKYPQENVTALVLDAKGTPLAVIRHSIGQADAASVEPWSLAGSVVQVPGAAEVYFAHNHPSGSTRQSTADNFITQRLHHLLSGSGIEPRGMIVVAPNSRSATYHRPAEGPQSEQEAPITAARRTGAVPLHERRFGRLRTTQARSISGPDDGKRAVLASGERSGVLLLNNHHVPLGVVPMTPDEMLRLRTGHPGYGAGRLLKAMAEANANALMTFGPEQAARNVAVFGNASGARTLDVLTWDSDGDLRSAAEHGTTPTGDVFLQRQWQAPAGWEEAFPRRATPLSIPEIRTEVDQFLAGFRIQPEVVIAKDLAELQRDPVVGPSLADEKDGAVVGFLHPATGKIYLVGDQFHHPADVAATLAHEVVTHFGLRAAFGDTHDARYQAILDGVRKAMPAEFRARGEAEFPGRFNPLNAHHRNRAAEEVLAYYGQRYAADQSVPARLKRWLDRLHALIRDWLRKVARVPQKFDALFVKRTLADLEAFLRRGRQQPSEQSAQSQGVGDGVARAAQRLRNAAQAEPFRSQGLGALKVPGQRRVLHDMFAAGQNLEIRRNIIRAIPVSVMDILARQQITAENLFHNYPVFLKLFATKSDADVPISMEVATAAINAGALQAAKMEGIFPNVGRSLVLGGTAHEAIDDGHGVAFSTKQDTFYSAVARAVDAAKRDKGTGAEWTATLRNMPGVRAEEIQWLGLADWLQGRGRVSKAEVADFVHAHRVQVGEVLKGAGKSREVDQGEILGATKYGQYVAPGGKNYRELLLTLAPHGDLAHTLAIRKAVFEKWAPRIAEVDKLLDDRLYGRGMVAAMSLEDLQKERDSLSFQRDAEAANAAGEVPEGALYRGGHWEEPNVLAHVRFDDRTGPNGERILHIAEVQSDWHQKGRRQGYAVRPAPARETEIRSRLAQINTELEAAPKDSGEWHALLVERNTLRGELDEGGTAAKVPDAPFKTTWPELAMKRMLHYAAEHGYDALSWDTGETSAERYDLSRHLSRVQLNDNSSGGIGKAKLEGPFEHGTLMAHDHSGRSVIEKHVNSAEELVVLIGKDLADKLLAAEPDHTQSAGIGMRRRVLNGLDLKVGGEGMKAFYDQMLPAAVGKLVKRWGGKVEPSVMKSDNAPEDVVERWAAEDPNHPFVLKNRMPVHLVRITPAMRDSVMGGQPLFQKRGDYALQALKAAREAREGGEALPYADPLTQRDETVAMFLKRRKGSTGAAAEEPKRGAYAMARRAVAAIPGNELTMSLRRIVDPAGVSPSAQATALVTREALGELAQASEEARKNLEEYAKIFDRLGTDDRYAFIDAMESGTPQANRDLQPAADAIRHLLDDWRDRIRALGVGALDNFIENYFPHIWQNDSTAKKIFGQIFGRRPLKGPASFLKERTIPTTKEGLEAGLLPISTNPLVLAFAKLREMQRFYTGVKLMQRFKEEGLAKFKPLARRMPEGWTEINDAVGRVMQWSEEEAGFILRGHYIMPTDAARVINNHLSASALRNFLPAQVFRVVSNAANALQLGFSAFHLGFTTLDAVISKNALGIERLLHGEPLRAAAAFLESASVIGAPALNLRRGYQLMKAYANVGGATPEMRRIVEALMASGGRVKMDNYFQAARGLSPFKGIGFATLASDVKAALTRPRGEVDSLTKVLTSFPQQYAMKLWRDLEAMWQEMPGLQKLLIPIEVTGRVVRASTSIIMEHIVPLQKLGVFSDLAADHIRRNPLEDPVAFAGAMQQIWNSVDNRLGEMVYDALFWNRTFKDVNHMLVRAVGWNLGTIRELGGAPVDVIKVLDYMARGAPPELLEAPGGAGQGPPPLGKTAQARMDYEAQKSKLHRIVEKIGHKIPYTLALVGTTMIVGAIMQYLFTGKKPEELKDYFFPWTGRMTKYGTKERVSLPSYMKDIYEYSTQPGTTVINKANPIFGIIHAIYANEDFFGNAIRFPEDPLWKQIIQGAQYAAREVLPFSIQGTKQFIDAGTSDARGKALSTLPYFGITPAPARVTSPEQMERYQIRETEKKYIRGLTYRLKQAREQGNTAVATELEQELQERKFQERAVEQHIREDKVKASEAAEAAAEKISSLIHGKGREDAAAALSGAGMPAFAALWRSLPDQPRPRVAASLTHFAA